MRLTSVRAFRAAYCSFNSAVNKSVAQLQHPQNNTEVEDNPTNDIDNQQNEQTGRPRPPPPVIYRLPPLPSIRDLVKLYKLRALKQLSQNFILDEKLTGKIAKAAGKLEGCYVCEVGPGPGGITRAILRRRAKKLILIEKDKRFDSALSLLKGACPPGTVDIFWGDVLSFEMSQMFPEECKKEWEDRCPNLHVIGNLPFSVATPLIVRWLKAISERKNVWSFGRVPLTLTFQQEVAERMVAEPSEEGRSRLSIMTQYLCHVHHKFTIPGSAFVPKPDVNVGVVKFVPRVIPLINQEFRLVEKVVRHVFSMRQKFCGRPTSTLFPKMVRPYFTDYLFNQAEVNRELRTFELSMDEFKSLCDAYAEIIKLYPALNDFQYRGFKPDEQWESLHGHAFESFRTIKTPSDVESADPEDNRDLDPDSDERFFLDLDNPKS